MQLLSRSNLDKKQVKIRVFTIAPYYFCYSMDMAMQGVLRFAKYSVVGVTTFLLDLFVLFLLTDFLLVNYILASGIAFLIAVTLNYAISRKYIFKGTVRGVKQGYFNFLIIVLVGLLVVTFGMYFLVTMLGFNYLVSRFCIAAITGLWNYLMNLFVNFKVAGKH